jgi:hypothetical protein
MKRLVMIFSPLTFQKRVVMYITHNIGDRKNVEDVRSALDIGLQTQCHSPFGNSLGDDSMIDRKDSALIEAPSKATILLATLVAALVAGVILLVAILPAEYGIDPLGTGKALGLTDLAKASGNKAAPAPGAAKTAEDSATIAPVLEDSPSGGAPVVKGAFIAQTKEYKFDSREITLKPGEGMEIKYNMKKGAGLIYSWQASDKLFFEFHGEPNVKPAGREGTDYYETYELDDKVGKDQAHGTFIAPSSGIHGWFWENKSPNEVTLKLVSAGFYDWVFQNRDDKETALKPMDLDSIPSHPKIPDEVLH